MSTCSTTSDASGRRSSFSTFPGGHLPVRILRRVQYRLVGGRGYEALPGIHFDQRCIPGKCLLQLCRHDAPSGDKLPQHGFFRHIIEVFVPKAAELPKVLFRDFAGEEALVRCAENAGEKLSAWVIIFSLLQ